MTIDDRRHGNIERTRRESLRVEVRHVRRNHERRCWQRARSVFERVRFPALPIACVRTTRVRCSSVRRMRCGSRYVLGKTRRDDRCTRGTCSTCTKQITNRQTLSSLICHLAAARKRGFAPVKSLPWQAPRTCSDKSSRAVYSCVQRRADHEVNKCRVRV
jgi:hypothetical protein